MSRLLGLITAGVHSALKPSSSDEPRCPLSPYRSLARVCFCACVWVEPALIRRVCVWRVCGLVWQVQVRFEARIHTTGTLALAASKSNNIIADPSIMGKELATQAQAEGIVAPAVGQVGVVVTTHDGVVNPTPGTTQQTGYTGSSAGLLGNLSQGETILVGGGLRCSLCACGLRLSRVGGEAEWEWRCLPGALDEGQL